MQKKEKEIIPLVVAFTPNYFVPAATCLSSILTHSPSHAFFHVICLLAEDLPSDMKEALEELDDQRFRFTYMNLAGKIDGIYVDERYTIAASYRLLLPDLLPEYDKVFYIDCDLVVRNDLTALFNKTDIEDYYLAAVFEAPLDTQFAYLEKLGMKSGNYFNSGFLLMNLKKLRADKMVEKLLRASKTPHLQFPDQDVLNLLCQGKVLGLPPYYNSIRTFYLPQYRKEFLRYYTELDWQSVQQHGTVHYTGGKPWHTYTVQFALWWNYYEQLPLTIQSKWKPSQKMVCFSHLYRTAWGRYIFEGIQQVVRRFKYGVS